jgi:hypothetical protein
MNAKAMVIVPRQQRRKRQGIARRSVATIPHPPQLNAYEVTYGRTLRFTAGSAFAATITFQNLLDLILMTTSATAPFDLFYMVRVKSVKVWTLPTIGTASTATVIFDGVVAGSQGDRKVHTDTSMGIEPAFVSCRPAAKTAASLFQIAIPQSAFFLECPGGSVIDVALDFKSDVLASPVAAQNVAVGAAVGVLAYRGLDGKAVATSDFVVPAGIYQI